MMAAIPETTIANTYWLALGRFLSYYANVEWQVNRLVRRYYRLGIDIGNIILGPLRYDSAIEHLNRLRAADRISEADAKEIDEIKAQLGPITKFRNDLAVC